MFPELRANVGFLWENRKLWNEMYLADIEADASKAPADKEADRVSCPAQPLFLGQCPPVVPSSGLHSPSVHAAHVLCTKSLV